MSAQKDYWFFLSYAKRDARSNTDVDGFPHIQKFFKDLADQINSLTGNVTDAQPKDIGFFDETGIEAGATSLAALTNGLCDSRVMVCLFSPSYFNREYCGKEFQYFRLRLEEWKKQYPADKAPVVVIPVYWEKPSIVRDGLPAAIQGASGMEIAEREFNLAYGEFGLNRILRLSKHADDYQEFLLNFAEYVWTKAKYATAKPMPAPPGSPSIDTVQHPFPVKAQPVAPPVTVAATAAATAAGAKRTGPDVAKFFYVTARRDEFDAGDTRRNLYGVNGWPEWQPFNPPLDDNIALIAQQVTGNNRFHYQEEDLDDDIKRDLEEANQNNVVAVVVVDSWSLRLPRYREMMLKCDSISLNNIVFLVVRNTNDQAVASSEQDLEKWLKLAFPTKATKPDKTYFINPVQSPKELQRHLRVAIVKAQKRIMEYNNLKKQVDEAGAPPQLPASGVAVSPAE